MSMRPAPSVMIVPSSSHCNQALIKLILLKDHYQADSSNIQSALYLIVRHTLKASSLGVEVTFLVANCPDNLLAGKAIVPLTVTESILQNSQQNLE